MGAEYKFRTGTSKPSKRSYSNFVTPPDFVRNRHHTVLLVDVDSFTVQQLALWCKTSQNAYNVYLYECTMTEPDWFKKVVERADAIIINSDISNLSEIKDQLALDNRAWYYGSRVYDNQPRQISIPLDYFLQYEQTGK
jgi:hypothetical protein